MILLLAASLTFPLVLPQQQPAFPERAACRRTIEGNPYVAGETLNLRLDLASIPAVTFKAELQFALLPDGKTPERSSAAVGMIAFGVPIDESHTRFGFQIPQEHMTGLYVVTSLLVTEIPGSVTLSSSQALDTVIGTCVRFSDNDARGLHQGVRGGTIEPRSGAH